MIWNPDFRFASILYHSRQPLAFWLFGIGAIVANNPLIGGRLVALLVSIPSFFALYLFMKKSFDQKTALISILLLTISPLAIMFQSLALMDGILFSSTFCIVYLLSEYRLHSKTQILLATGLMLGILLWIKTTALFIITPTIFTALTIFRLSFFNRTKQIVNFLILLLPIILIALLLLLLPNFSKIVSEPGSFIFSLKELMTLPTASWVSNGVYALYGYMTYFTPIVFLFGLIGAYKYRKEKSTTPLIFFALTILFSILLGKIFRIRYILYALIGIIPFTALFLSQTHLIRSVNRLKYIFCIGSSFLISLMLIINPHLFFSLFPENSTLSREREYAYGWTAGDGIQKLIDFIDKTPRSSHERIILFTEDSPGNPSDYVLAKYYFDPTVIISPIDISASSLRSLSQKKGNTPVFVIARSIRVDQTTEPYLSLIQSFSEHDPHEALHLYQLKSP